MDGYDPVGYGGPLMGTSMNPRRLRAIIGAAALAAALVVPVAVSADTIPGSTRVAVVTVDPNIRVLNKVVATVNVSFTCDPFLVYDWETGQYVQSTAGFLEGAEASLTQASGKTIASGSGNINTSAPVTCDGATVNAGFVTIAATAVPWKNGAAVVLADVHVVDSTFQTGDNGTSGPVSVKLTGK
jgi:hypothetical protein